MNRPRSVSPFILLSLVPLFVLFSCTSPITESPTSNTGSIEGHARYSGQTDHSGIIISAESTDGAKSLTVSRMLAGSLEEPRAIAAQSTTDASGTYSLTGLVAGTYTVYASSQNSLEKAVTTGVTVAAGRMVTAADLNLTPTGQIEGKATLNGATSGNLGIVVFIAGTSYSAMTDDVGGFTISGVPAGTGYVLVASKVGYTSVIVNPVNVTAASTTDVGTLSLASEPEGDVTTLAGTAGVSGSADGMHSAALFYRPYHIATDGANLYVADAFNYTIRKILISTGIVTTLAGQAGVTGHIDGTGIAAVFGDHRGITTDGTNLYVAEYYWCTIRKIVISSGVVTTLAGTAGVSGTENGTGSAARFNYPYGLATDGANLFVADSGNHTIRKIVISSGVVTTLAGTAGFVGSADGTGSAARFWGPSGITTDGTNLYVTDSGNHTIRKIVISSGVVTTLAGTAGSYGSADGTGGTAQFSGPYGIATDGTNLFVADTYNNTIRKIVISSGVVTTLAGTAGSFGSADGKGSTASFYWPYGIATDGTNLFVADTYNQTIRVLR